VNIARPPCDEGVVRISLAFNYGWGFPATPPTTRASSHRPILLSRTTKTPVFAYAHGATANTGCGINGGASYDPAWAQLPSQHRGKYFYTDYCNGWIRAFNAATGGSYEP
jgi:hypothetical protein